MKIYMTLEAITDPDRLLTREELARFLRDKARGPNLYVDCRAYYMNADRTPDYSHKGGPRANPDKCRCEWPSCAEAYAIETEREHSTEKGGVHFGELVGFWVRVWRAEVDLRGLTRGIDDAVPVEWGD